MAHKIRKYLLVNGIVQAVGFRPFVYNLARGLKLCGFCANTDKGVEIELEGPLSEIEEFKKRLYSEKPALSIIDSLEEKDLEVLNSPSFTIKHSSGKQAATAIPADIAICKDCQADIADKNNRRYRYPFTNCTACGPRFTIIKTVPYDRPKTTMHKFKMCPLCKAEFEDFADRRFHAQPNCCPVCGPQVFLLQNGKTIKQNALEKACGLLLKGKIVIIKSLGGFHIACNALDAAATAKLRKRKTRPHKPLALMCKDLKAAQKYCYINEAEAKILQSPQAPIVALKKRKDLKGIADGLNTIGIMLPYTPLHKIIFDIIGDIPLVMTSANRSEEPICITNKEAVQKLGHIADAFLLHNRDIYNRIDDSLVFELNGKMHFLRRARGFVPTAVKINEKLREPLLALGGDLTSAFCLAKDNKLYLSQYIGDLDNAENTAYFKQTLAKMQKLLNIRPQIAVRDLHPAYFGASFKPKAALVQHHLAHALSVNAEHNINADTLAFCFDGTGLGADGSIWGAEILLIRQNNWRRIGALDTINIIGADSASRDVWKAALSYMLWADTPLQNIKKILKEVKPAHLNTALKAYRSGINCYRASSMGRLFDAAAAIAGLRCFTSYQAQAAMELESLYKPHKLKPYSFGFEEQDDFLLIKTQKLIKQIINDAGKAQIISCKFHSAVADMIVKAAKTLGKKYDAKTITLSGGVFQNKVLLGAALAALEAEGFTAYTNEALPAGDGGIAIGQVYAKHKNFV